MYTNNLLICLHFIFLDQIIQIIQIGNYNCLIIINLINTMLTQNLILECQKLSSLEQQDYIKVRRKLTKVINYSINRILNQQNQMKLNQFIQIDQKEGEQLTNITLNLIYCLSTYNCNINFLQQKIKLLKFDKPKTEYLKEKIKDNLDELRKTLYKEELANITTLSNLQWRFQIQVASKSLKNQFRPNIVLNFQTSQAQNQSRNNVMNCDFANLKNLQSQLNSALKLHRNPKYKTAKNSSV